MRNPILDPTGRQSREKKAALAPRPADLRGATIGLLQTPKKNADLFLEELGRLFVDHHGAAGLITRKKTSVAEPASAEVADELVQKCDVVVTGVGDCGSCSASAVMDGVLFEGRGVPSAVVVSDAFTVTSDAMARMKGAPGYRYVTTSHPIASLTPDEIRERAAHVLPGIVSLLVTGEMREVA